MWHDYVIVANLDDALRILDKQGEKSRIIAGATDLMLEIERGIRKEIDTLIDVSKLPDLNRIYLDSDGWIHIGPLATHNDVVSSNLLRDHAYPLVQAAWQVGSPQIRNRGTIAGNLITASPANDTITPLMALRAQVVLRSLSGERVVPLDKFYRGVRTTVMQPDEFMSDIRFQSMQPGQVGSFIKIALRQAQAISVVNSAVILEMEREIIQSAVITLGAVAPVIIYARRAEDYLVGKRLTSDVIWKASELAANEANPISDVRGSAAYRSEMVRVAFKRSLEQIAGIKQYVSIPSSPVLLNTHNEITPLQHTSVFQSNSLILTHINGKSYTFQPKQNKSLLRLLREDAHLVGTKEGCAEGECGSCTVIMDGMAVMSCLVPAPRAHQSNIKTIEGLAQGENLHPLQKSFIEAGAVQCGYCTPGILMSAAALLSEVAHPDREQIKQAITGNLCRCTGYYQVIRAIELASMIGGE